MLRTTLLLACCAAAHALGPVRAFTGATLVNPGRAPVPAAVVLVQDGRITAAGSAAEVPVPAGAEVVAAAGKWIIPGLIDAHVHFFQSGGIYTRPDVLDLRAYRSYEQDQALIRRDLADTFARYLRCGITSAIDMGGPDWNFEVRALAARTALAPRLRVSGPLLTPGPIRNFRTGEVHFLTTGADPAVRAGLAPDAARAEVRRQAALGTDFIKIWVSEGATTATQQAIYEEAARLGLKVAVHATRLAGATEAVRAGAAILVHSITDQPIPDGLLQEMKRRGVVLIPTLVVERGYAIMTSSRRFRFAPWEFELANPEVMGTFFDLLHLPLKLDPARLRTIQEGRAWEPGAVAMDNLRRLIRAGVTVAAGTDAGNPGTFHGASLWTELELMARAGLSPAEVLECATRGGARVLCQEADLGSVAPGRLADFLLLDADPLLDILNVRRLHRVVKGGEVLDPAALLQPGPEAVVQRQLNAYNARDTEAFAATYAPAVSIRTLPETVPTAEGREAVRSRWGKAFRDNPDSAVRIAARITQGSFVIDQEVLVHRWDPARTRPAGTAVYEVRDGLIQTVWFLKER
jgi:imidazolonepropionase-like amidohydrolase